MLLITGRRASEVLAKHIIVDMFAKAMQGTAAEQALAWVTGELKEAFGA